MNCPVCAAPNPAPNRYCGQCGAALSGLPGGEAENRLVTVLFADMTGSTAMSERLDAEEVHDIMSEFYQELAACVHRYGGTVDKFLGDGIMALFGAPRAHEDDPERALATALEMREGVAAMNQRLGARLPNRIGIHIGVNTGQVVAGRVGGASRSDYTVLGDPVNVAARLEDRSVDGQILVSETTKQLTEHAFAFSEPESIQVKGKADPVNVFELRGRRAKRRSARGHGLEARLVGRGAELGRLRAALDRLEHGVGGHASVTGAAGVGKSRLLTEARLAAATRSVKWVQAACPSLGLGGTLAVWGDLMRRLLGLDDTGTRTTGGIRRTTGARRSGGTKVISLNELRDASSSLVELLGLEWTADERRRSGIIDEEVERNRLFVGVRDAVEAEAGRQPLVLVLDDLHWVDSASMQLLGRVLESTTRVPLLVVTAFRSDAATVRAPLDEALAHAAPPFHVEIELQPLSESDSAELASALLNGADPRLDEVRGLLVSSSDGNPLFLEEILRSLEEQGAIRRENGGWFVTQEQREVVVPETLQGLLLDRIDRLPESSKRVVQIAAVIGRSFPSELLGDILGLRSQPALLLTTLEQAGILERSRTEGPAGADYRFRHALMQEAAYASLLHKHRQAYHRRVADWYEGHYGAGEPPAGLAAILAHHYDRAEAVPEAAAWTLRAGDEARYTYALDEARDRYTRALQLVGMTKDAQIRGRALAGLGEVAVAEGALEAAIERFTAALELAREPLERATLERRTGQVHDRLGRQALALAAFSRAAALLGEERPGEPVEWTAERGRLRVARAFAHLNRGDEPTARATAEAALRTELPPADRADATALLGAAHLRHGEADEAARRFAEALALARASGDLLREASALEQIARAYRHLQRFEDARQALAECLALRRKLSDEAGCGLVLVELALVDEHDGALTAAEQRLREAADSAAACDDPVMVARAHLHLGRILGTRGDWAAARAALERAGGDDPEAAGRVTLELALLAVARREAPEPALRQALAGAELHGAADIAAHARLGLATIARRAGQHDEARALLRDVLVAAGGQEDDTTTAARAELAELALIGGNPESTVAAARMALVAAQRTGPAALAWRAHRVLGTALGLAGLRDEAEPHLRLATEACRTAGAYPELARCLDAWARLRLADGHTPEPETQAMLAEMRAILAYLAGGPPPTGDRGLAEGAGDGARVLPSPNP